MVFKSPCRLTDKPEVSFREHTLLKALTVYGLHAVLEARLLQTVQTSILGSIPSGGTKHKAWVIHGGFEVVLGNKERLKMSLNQPRGKRNGSPQKDTSRHPCFFLI